MTQAVTAGVGQATYAYDGFLNRVKVNDASHVLDRTLPYNNLLMADDRRFTWGNELISATNEREMFYLQDHLGSPIRLMHHWQTPLAYDVFGGMTAGMTPNAQQPFGFTGYEVDQVSGLQFAQARYYAPEVGRFSAEDPHWGPHNMIYGDLPGSRVPDVRAIQQSANPYAYCGGNPLGFVDPRGLMECELEARHRDMFQDLLGPQYMEWWYVFNERFSGHFEPEIVPWLLALSGWALAIVEEVAEAAARAEGNMDFRLISGEMGAAIGGVGLLLEIAAGVHNNHRNGTPEYIQRDAVTTFLQGGSNLFVSSMASVIFSPIAGPIADDLMNRFWNAAENAVLRVEEHNIDRMRIEYPQYTELFSRYLPTLYN